MLLRAPYLTDIASENTHSGSGNLSALTRVLIIIKEVTHKARKMRRGIEARTELHDDPYPDLQQASLNKP